MPHSAQTALDSAQTALDSSPTAPASAALSPLALCKLLADATRLTIVQLLVDQGELCVCELIAALDQPQPTVSRHLSALKKAQLLCDRKQGQWVFYRLAAPLPAWQQQVLAQLTVAADNQLPLARLNAMGNRPERSTLCGQSIALANESIAKPSQSREQPLGSAVAGSSVSPQTPQQTAISCCEVSCE